MQMTPRRNSKAGWRRQANPTAPERTTKGARKVQHAERQARTPNENPRGQRRAAAAADDRTLDGKAGSVIDLATAAGKPDPVANTPCHIGGISAARRKTTGAEQQSGSMQMTPQPDTPRGEAKGANYKVAGVQTPGGPNGP